MHELLQPLVTLSNELGREDRQLAMLGEGNTSARGGDNTFWVKASGSQLVTITEGGFTQVKIDAILALVEREQMTQEEVQAIWPEVMGRSTAEAPVGGDLHARALSDRGWRQLGGAHAPDRM
jgi:rhamnose utilization protein RhaD (predicted bifunctional aldolase and dehydrogenase)